MKSSIQPQSLWSILAVVGQAVAFDLHGSYFVLNHGPPLVSERLDPIISPGQNPSNHVHNVFGANTFSPTFDFNAAQKASCNTHGVKPDMSNYWYPALYFHDKAANTYKMVPTQLETYYHFDPINGVARTAFPPGFMMIAGNAMTRHNDSTTNVATKSIRWYCHGPKEVVEVGGFGTGFSSCPNYPGYSAEIWFPFCFDGNMNFDHTNPMAHMAYGQGSDGTPTQQGGTCPGSHPTALPQIFAEFHHDMAGFTWTADEQPFVLAQGDPTGFGMHMDFVSGWDVKVLQDAISITSGTNTKCRIGESGDPLSACFEMLPQSTVSGCTIASVVQGDGDVTNPGSALPGCNPLQPGPQDATIQTNCAGYKPPTVQPPSPVGSSAAVAPVSSGSAPAGTPSVTGGPTGTPGASSAASAPLSPVESGSTVPSDTGTTGVPSSVLAAGSAWIYQGCYSDLVPDRSIRTLPTPGRANSGATADTCAIDCAAQGFQIAGIEDGWQCFCGHTLNKAQAKKLDDSKCNMPCAGSSSSQTCGGNGAIQVYAPSGTSLTKRSPHIHRHHRDLFRKTA